MTREETIRLVMGARTLAECARASNALRAWTKRYPHDTAVGEGGEQLAMILEGLEHPIGGGAPISSFDPRSPELDEYFGQTLEEMAQEIALVAGWTLEEAVTQMEELRREVACGLAPRTDAQRAAA